MTTKNYNYGKVCYRYAKYMLAGLIMVPALVRGELKLKVSTNDLDLTLVDSTTSLQQTAVTLFVLELQ